jgi:hypothetical protein
MEPPKKVQVGPITFAIDISLEAGLIAKTREQKPTTVGHIDHNEQRIYIDGAQGPDQIRDTLLHEVLHALWGTCGLYVTEAGDHEELIVAMTASLLLDTLRRNPELVAYLVAADG